MAAGVLPEDLLADILSRLPVKSLLRFKCVHKTWNSLLKSSQFITKNLKNPNNKDRRLIFVKYEDPENHRHRRMRLLTCDTFDVRLDFSLPLEPMWCFYVIGSCNGLICLHDVASFRGMMLIILWNPCLNESKIIPESSVSLLEKADFFTCAVGFYYDSRNNDYKVVRVDLVIDKEKGKENGKGFTSLAEVYTLGTNSWRQVGELDILINRGEHQALVNGAMHWLGVKNKERCVVSFNVSSEVFQLLPSPNCFAAEKCRNARIDVYKDLLCVINWVKYVRFEIWVMEDYGVKGSWTKLYSIKLHLPCPNPEILGFGVSGELLVDFYRKLTVYYPDNGFKEIFDADDRVGFVDVLNYTESLVSLEQY